MSDDKIRARLNEFDLPPGACAWLLLDALRAVLDLHPPHEHDCVYTRNGECQERRAIADALGIG